MTNVGPQRSGGGVPKWLLVLGGLFLLIVLLCCGGITTCVLWGKRQVAKIQTEGIGGVTLNKDGTGFTVKTEEGEVNLGGGSLPASFPKDLPVYAGMRAQSSAVNTKEGSGTAVLTGKATTSDVADWYEKRMKADGWTEAANQSVGEGSSLAFTKGDREVSVLVVPAGDGQVAVTLSFQKKAGGATGEAGLGETPRLEGNGGAQEKVGPAGGGAEAVTAERAAQLKAMKLPANFPKDVPVYKGMVSTFSASDNLKGSGWVVLEGNAPVETVADYYSKQMAEGGWTEAENKQVAEAKMMKYTKDTREVTVQVGPGDKGMTLLQLMYEKKGE
jgi:hypothetical protein